MFKLYDVLDAQWSRLGLSVGPNYVGSFPRLNLMPDADPSFETLYNLNIHKIVDNTQHNIYIMNGPFLQNFRGSSS
jgi:hypothetical protein